MTNLLALPVGTELVGDFRIKKVIGAGGFGITYLAEEVALQRDVTIKEYFPSDFAARANGKEAKARSRNCSADYKWGLDRFIEEAQTLARFDHPNIVRVYRYFRTNNTGYMVLHFEEGKSLKGWLKSLGRVPRQAELDALLEPILDALDLIHGRDFLHRDIAPDNIIVRKDKSPVLIDFGSARGEIATHSRTVSALVKPGYSPYEQYASTTRQQGPWTDIYALGATIYQVITGKRPPDAPSRMVNDDYVPARAAALGSYRAGFLAAIDHSLRLDIGERPQSVAVWRKALFEQDRAEPPPPAATPKVRTGLIGGIARPSNPTPIPIPTSDTPGAPQPPVPLLHGGGLDVLERSAPAAKPAMPVRSLASLFGYGKSSAPAKAIAASEPKASAGALVEARSAKPVLEVAPAVPAARGSARPAPVERRHPSKQNKGWFFLRQPWRGLLLKLSIGVAVASLLVAYQDLLVPQPAPAAKRQTARTVNVPSPVPPVQAVSPAAMAPVAEKRELPELVLAPTTVLGSHSGPAIAIAVAGNGRITTTGTDGVLKVWDVERTQLARSIMLPAGAATGLAADNGFALTSHSDGVLALWDVENGQQLRSYKADLAPITALSFAERGRKIVAGARDGRIAMWERHNGEAPVSILDAHLSGVVGLVRVGTQSAIVSAGSESNMRLLSTRSLKTVRQYRGHRSSVTALDSSPGGRLLFSGDADGNVRAWSLSSARAISTLEGHSGAVTALSIAPRSDLLASAGVDGMLKIWDRRRGRILASVASPGGIVRASVFVDDGRGLVTASEDGHVRLWNTEPFRAAVN